MLVNHADINFVAGMCHQGMYERPTVFVVEDNKPVRESITWILEQQGIAVRAFESAAGLLSVTNWDTHGCLLLDMRLPDMSGIELRRRVLESGCKLPFIIVSGQGQIPDVKEAFQDGAVDFIEKPIDREVLLQRVRQAFEMDLELRQDREKHENVQARLDTLTNRENEVLNLVVDGMLTKQIAKQLGVSVKTVEVHRSNITKKMKVKSVIHLVKMIIEHRTNPVAN